MQTSVQETFKELSQVQQNNACFECGAPSCHWVSVNNGIFLCLSCSTHHRGFGPSVSHIRSILMDSWSDEQLALVKNGGNAALWACFNNYNIPNDKPIDYKFRTKAGVYYREMLKALAEEKQVPQPPLKEEGAELAAVESQSAKGKDGNILDKITVNSMAQGATDLGNSIATGTKNIVNKMNNPNLTNEVVEYGASLGEKTFNAMEETIEKTKEAWANRDELMKKTSDAAVKGWESTVKSTVSFWKKITGKKEDNAVENIVLENPVAEPVVESIVEPVVENTATQPIAEPVVENVATQPIAEPVAVEQPKEEEEQKQ